MWPCNSHSGYTEDVFTLLGISVPIRAQMISFYLTKWYCISVHFGRTFIPPTQVYHVNWAKADENRRVARIIAMISDAYIVINKNEFTKWNDKRKDTNGSGILKCDSGGLCADDANVQPELINQNKYEARMWYSQCKSLLIFSAWRDPVGTESNGLYRCARGAPTDDE